jgi:hypothetical protein
MRQAPAFVHAIEHSGVGHWLRNSVLAMPIVETAHVLCVTLLFGTILVVDLRLLGWRDRARPVTVVEHEMLPVTWAAFAGAVVTGLMFFSANATTYWFNTAFRIKMLTILLAGVNMAVFQLITFRSVASWDREAPTPRAARIAGALSILLWVVVIALGRTIGFTKGYDFTVPAGVDFDFGSGP